jgi:prepilin-type N-terminal cleavage/methylation domain-containing protein/prepilin-type processing-associated H-X9-DG protein
MGAARVHSAAVISHRSADCGRPGFTLIELLVVIAIIALLAALLLPVLARAKLKGQQIACVNNLRQQSLALFLYADDNGNILPPVAYDDANDDEVDWPALLDPYIKTPRIHLCPCDLISQQISYGLNELGFVDLTDPGVTTPNRLTAFHAPTTTMMMGDVGTEDDMITPRPDTFKMIAPGSSINDDADARPVARHAQRCGLGFMDGHAEALRLDQFYLDQNPTNKWFSP